MLANERLLVLLLFVVLSLTYITLSTMCTQSVLQTDVMKIQKLFLKSIDSRSSSKTHEYKSHDKMVDKYSQEQSNEWLERSTTFTSDFYGNETCPPNSDRPYFKKLLKEWVRIAKKYRIRYFLAYGSLLGAWRNGETIPYDADTDVYVHLDDIQKLLVLRQRNMTWNAYDDHKFHLYITIDWELPLKKRRRFTCKGEKVEKYEGQCSFTIPYGRLIFRQWHLDLFVYTHYHKTLKFIPYNDEFMKDDFIPSVKCKFMGIETRCPRNPKNVLDAIYSNYMKPYKICRNNTWIHNSQ